ncbi:MAG: C40 family peptidase [Bacteroidales bacterium]|jgi:cell wall-associated NlpC family hydrolase|nr:C40 family peptidase [Bacteroidales bacterium]HOL98200.1 C40 family peptidase [Bacteroidales bacterium]HOM36423.1 C40 family peptidase [Bacteroidales bacterium]HPD23903.1 C40 family peptidase [Bacteroidales bacterium]HRS99974.1 C40 family peptidase [Bacteroidales bacterium]
MKRIVFLVKLILLLVVFFSCSRKTTNIQYVVYDPNDPGVENETKPTPKNKEQNLLESVVEFSKTLVGSPYKYGGTTPQGFDCSGFVQYVFAQKGINIPRIPLEMAKISERIELKNVKPGDLLYFKGSDKNTEVIGHVALVIENNNGKIKMIHATTSKGVIINDFDEYDYWKTRFLFAARFPSNIILKQ